MAAIFMLAALKNADKPASEALRKFTPLPQRIINTKDDRDRMIATIAHANVQSVVADAETDLGSTGRIVIRPSGTEPLLRVMVEAEDQHQMNAVAELIATTIEAELNA